MHKIELNEHLFNGRYLMKRFRFLVWSESGSGFYANRWLEGGRCL